MKDFELTRLQEQSIDLLDTIEDVSEGVDGTNLLRIAKCTYLHYL